MSHPVIKVENLSKQYRLGKIGTGSFAHDINRWIHQIRGLEDPYLKIGEENDRTKKTDSEFVWSLRDVSFSIDQGDAVGIIGRNGAGKSTLLKILSRTTSPTTGKIKIKGRVASLLEVGTGFHPELTGRENIFLNGAILGMSKFEIKKKFDEIVDFSGVERYIDTPVKRYSSGMYVRLAFGVAAHLEPEILIVDEVLAVGDSEFQKKALGKMQDVSKGEGRTVLFVSHNMAAIKNLCQKGIVLKNGTVQYIGAVEAAIGKYLQGGSQTDVSLEHRDDRYGNQWVKFTGISFLNKEGKPIESVMTGDYLKVGLSLQVNRDIDATKLIIGVNFRDEFENNIVTFLSDEMGSQFNYFQESVVFLEIPNLFLRSATYSLRLFAAYKDTNPDNICDSIENSISLKVESTDFWNSGRILRPNNEAIFEAKYF